MEQCSFESTEKQVYAESIKSSARFDPGPPILTAAYR